MKRLFLLLALVCWSLPAIAADYIGPWKIYDNIMSNRTTSALVVTNSTGVESATTAVTNGLATITTVTGATNATYSAFASADLALSNTLVTAYGSADLTLSNAIVVVYGAADLALSNTLAAATVTAQDDATDALTELTAPVGINGPWLLASWHTAGNGSPTTRFSIYKSGDLTNWVAAAQNPVTPVVGYLHRDPSMYESNGVFYACYTSAFGNTNSFNIDATASLQNGSWANLCAVDASAVQPTESVVYAPEWAVEPDGTRHVTFTVATGGGDADMRLFRVEPTDSTLANWSTPTQITINGASHPNFNDSFYVYRNGQHTLWYTGNNNNIYWATASTFAGPYTEQGVVWAGWNTDAPGGTEGPSVFPVSNGQGGTNWVAVMAASFGAVYPDDLRLGYSVSTDDWATWSTLAKLNVGQSVNHATPLLVSSQNARRVYESLGASGTYGLKNEPFATGGSVTPQVFQDIQDTFAKSGFLAYSNGVVSLVFSNSMWLNIGPEGQFSGGDGGLLRSANYPAFGQSANRIFAITSPTTAGNMYYIARAYGSGAMPMWGNKGGTNVLAVESGKVFAWYSGIDWSQADPFSGATQLGQLDATGLTIGPTNVTSAIGMAQNTGDVALAKSIIASNLAAAINVRPVPLSIGDARVGVSMATLTENNDFNSGAAQTHRINVPRYTTNVIASWKVNQTDLLGTNMVLTSYWISTNACTVRIVNRLGMLTSSIARVQSLVLTNVDLAANVITTVNTPISVVTNGPVLMVEMGAGECTNTAAVGIIGGGLTSSP